jgi:acyl-CoA reductase-like NAD-dependent aldehyde dehydrogenase
MVTSTAQIGHLSVSTGLYINGEWVEGHGKPLDTINPATEQAIGTVRSALTRQPRSVLT